MRSSLVALAVGVATCWISGTAHAQTGPSFKCRSPRDPLGQLICSSPDLTQADLWYVQAYQALRTQLDPGGQSELRQEAETFNQTVRSECGVGAVDSGKTASPSAIPCVQRLFMAQRDVLASRLTGAAAEEAARPVQPHIALQADLKRLGFLPPDAAIDGVFGPITRKAIQQWQESRGRRLTGLLDNSDGALLEQQATSAMAQPANFTGPQPASLWNHNGSLMSLDLTGDQLRFAYVEPRPGMIDAGARPASPLLEGRLQGARISGVARIFAWQCGQFPYQVDGEVSQNGTRITLKGSAPRVERATCAVKGSTPDVLNFDLKSGSPIATGTPTASSPASVPPTSAQKPTEQATAATTPKQRPLGEFIGGFKEGYRQAWQGDTAKPENPPTPSTAVVQSPSMPASQQQFLSIMDDFAAKYKAATNEMASGALRPQRARAICDLLKGGRVTDWVGTVQKLSSNNEGKGVLEVSMSKIANANTWSNSLSDFSEPGTPLHEAAIQLSRKQTIIFSGTFVKGDKDCFRESSITQRGSMTDPDWIFRFSSVKPAS